MHCYTVLSQSAVIRCMNKLCENNYTCDRTSLTFALYTACMTTSMCLMSIFVRLFPPSAVRCWAEGHLKVGYVRVPAETARRTRTTSGSNRPWMRAWPKTAMPASAVSHLHLSIFSFPEHWLCIIYLQYKSVYSIYAEWKVSKFLERKRE